MTRPEFDSKAVDWRQNRITLTQFFDWAKSESNQVEAQVSDDCELRGRLKENQMYYKSMTDIYYSEMNKDSENTIWLKIRDLFEKRIKELEEQIASNSR